MTLSMDQVGQLGGFLQVGPHYFPKKPQGAQVIMRGPHGQRLAADPVYIREHNQPRGSGFRFWHEELNIAPNVKWNPQQVVTGVMGMGDLPVGWACPYTRSQMGEEIAKVEAAVKSATTPAQLELVRAQNEKLRECHMQLGQNNTFKSHLHRINEVGAAIARRKGLVHPSVVTPGGKFIPQTQEEYCRQNPSACFPESRCAPYDVVCLSEEWIKKNWWKVALGVGGAIAIYGFAGGAGKRLAAKIL